MSVSAVVAVEKYGFVVRTDAERLPFLERAEQLLDIVPRALLVYGSRSRCDAVPGSDIDLLALIDAQPRTIRDDEVSLTCYTPLQIGLRGTLMW